MQITEQKERNEKARKEIEKINKGLGIKIKHLGSHLQLSSSSFSQWRIGIYDFGSDRLNQVEALIGKYNNIQY